MDREDLEVLALALWPESEYIECWVSLWLANDLHQDPPLGYHPPHLSHDTIHAIEKTLTPEEQTPYLEAIWDRYWLKPWSPASKLVDGSSSEDNFTYYWVVRHAPASVCAEALVEVLKGRE